MKNVKIFLQSYNYNKTEKIRARNMKDNLIDDDNWYSGSDNTDMDDDGTLINNLLSVFKK